MKAKELIKQIEEVGWEFVRQKGSHMIFKKEGEIEHITVPNHGSRDLKKPLVLSILKQAGLR
jgi:predicted RNA binding protein YcfA (HicA-like mRNA interferase family)